MPWAGVHAPSIPSTRPVAPPAAVRHDQQPQRLHSGERSQPEPAHAGPISDPSRRELAAHVHGGAGRRPVRRGHPVGASRQDQLLQLVRDQHIAGSDGWGRLLGVGAGQRRMGPRLRARCSHGARRHARRRRRPAVLPAPEACRQPHHQNPSGTYSTYVRSAVCRLPVVWKKNLDEILSWPAGFCGGV